MIVCLIFLNFFMPNYKDIKIFQCAYNLTLDIYRITSKFTKEYKYSLGGKMKDISHELLDLIDRYKIRNTNLIKILIDLVVASVAKEFSINKHYQDLKSRNIALSKGTLYEYFSVLEDAFFVFSIKRFSHSQKTEDLSISKIYLGDVGFLNLYSLENFGQRLENIVFLHLFRQTVQNSLLKINYWLSGQNEEIDFVVQEGKKIKSLIQVSYKIDDLETKKREIKSMLKGMDALNVSESLIVTLETEGEEKVDNKKIRIIPIWKLNDFVSQDNF